MGMILESLFLNGAPSSPFSGLLCVHTCTCVVCLWAFIMVIAPVAMSAGA